MRLSILCLSAALVASPAAAQTHQRHSAAHDSAHSIMLSDAEHMALHQLLLGQWKGQIMRDDHREDLDIRFENDSAHQMLHVRHRSGVSDFQIRGDTLSWNQPVNGGPCVATTQVSSLLKATKAKTTRAQIDGTLSCGAKRTTFTLTKAAP